MPVCFVMHLVIIALIIAIAGTSTDLCIQCIHITKLSMVVQVDSFRFLSYFQFHVYIYISSADYNLFSIFEGGR